MLDLHFFYVLMISLEHKANKYFEESPCIFFHTRRIFHNFNIIINTIYEILVCISEFSVQATVKAIQMLNGM